MQFSPRVNQLCLFLTIFRIIDFRILLATGQHEFVDLICGDRNLNLNESIILKTTTMIRSLMLLLGSLLCSPLWAQHSLDNCEQALPIELSLPSTCPESSIVSDTFNFSLDEALPTAYLSSSSCADPEVATAGGDIWVTFLPKGNELTLTLSGVDQPHLILMRGEACESLIPIGCASGEATATLQAGVSRNEAYHLLIAGGAGTVNLTISSTNNCSPCTLVRDGYFTASPAPVNGRYPSGQEVQMCFTVDRWSSTPNSELLHALELEFDEGWDRSTFTPQPPASCSGNGTWGWYDGWVSEATGEAFGPGFAFDEIKNGLQDGNPGNNRGLDGIGCADIGGMENNNTLQFCWTVATADCPPAEFGYPASLGIDAQLLGDGLSGSWWQTACYHPVTESFGANLYCPDDFAPHITVNDASCGENCDGSLALAGAAEGPWDYVLSDTSGNLLYLATSIPGPDTITGLCPGLYEVLIVDNASNESRRQLVEINTGIVPTATAHFTLPCFEGEPIPLSAIVDPPGGDINYLWTGPNGYTRTTPDPLALSPGLYTLNATVNGCPASPSTFTIPVISDIEIVQLGPDTVTICPGEAVTLASSGTAESLIWTKIGSDGTLSTADSIDITPTNGSSYRVEGTSANGCTGSDQIYFRVDLTPTLTVAPTGTICPGESASLAVDQGSSWAWSTGDTTQQISVAPSGNTNYAVTVTDDNGCNAVLSATVAVASSTGFFVFQDQELCAGESTMLAASGGEHFLWSTGDTTNSITVTPDTTQTYAVTQTDGFGCSHTDSVTVTVNPDPALTYIPEEVLICEGDEVTLQLYQADTLLWDTLVRPVADAAYPPPFDFGCQSVPAFQVFVSPLPEVAIEGPNTLCGQDSILLTGTGIGQLQWGDGTFGDSLIAYPDGPTTYYLTATDTIIGCSGTDSLTLSPVAAPLAPDITCESRLGAMRFSWPLDTSYTYTVTVDDGPEGFFQSTNQYILIGLSPGQTVNITLEVSQNTSCTTTVSASCTAPDCSVLDPFTLVPEAACEEDGSIALLADVAGGTNQGQGEWAGPGLDSTGLIFDPALAGAGMHELVYTYTDQGCTLSDTSVVEVSGKLSPDRISCSSSGDTLIFDWPAQPQDTAYEVTISTGQTGLLTGSSFWVAGLVAGDTVGITITVLTDGPCSAYQVSTSCTLSTPVCPTLEVPVDTFICNGDSVQFNFVDTTVWNTYSWAPASTLSCADCPHPTASPETTTAYQLIASDNDGCSDTIEYTVYVQEFPTGIIPDEPITFCPGEPFELCMPDGDIHYWIGPNAFIDTDQCLSFGSIAEADAGNYYAFMRVDGCRFLKPFTLQAAPALVVNTTPGFQTVCPNDTFNIAATATGANRFHWSPAEYVDCPDCPTTTGSVPQTVTFVLTATDTFGCSATEQAVVFVEDCSPAPRPGNGNPKVSTLKVFPNPASQRAEVLTQMEGLKTLQLWSVTGQQITSMTFEGQRWMLAVDNLPAGTYYLKVFNEETSEQARLIISR